VPRQIHEEKYSGRSRIDASVTVAAVGEPKRNGDTSATANGPDGIGQNSIYCERCLKNGCNEVLRVVSTNVIELLQNHWSEGLNVGNGI